MAQRDFVREIQLSVCGGPGTHTVYLPSFGNSRVVSRLVER